MFRPSDDEGVYVVLRQVHITHCMCSMSTVDFRHTYRLVFNSLTHSLARSCTNIRSLHSSPIIASFVGSFDLHHIRIHMRIYIQPWTMHAYMHTYIRPRSLTHSLSSHYVLLHALGSKVYVNVYIYIYIYNYICLSVSVSLRTCLHAFAHMHACMCTNALLACFASMLRLSS